MFNNTDNENLSNKGIQVDLGEYLEYKKQFKDTRTISYSSSDLYHKRKKEQEEARSDFFIYGGAAAVSTKVLYEKAKKDEGIRALIEEAPGAKLLKQKLTKQFLDNQAAQIISGAIDPRSTAVAPLSQSLQSILVSLEELSPSQILKTLQLSSFNSLFVEVIDEERKKARHIKQTSIQVYENYYKNLIFKESKIKLMDEDIKHGFILQNNKLYQAVPEAGNKGEVKAGRVLLDYATVVNSTIKTGDSHHSVNRVFEKFSNIYDANLNRNQLHTEPFIVVGGASKRSTVSTWARAYGRFSLEIGAKSLDNPLGFLEEYLDMTGLNNSKLVKNKYFQTAKSWTNFKLGTGGVYNISSAEMMKKIGKNLAIKGAAGVVGLNIVDATLDALTPDSSVWSNGLIAGMADTFMKAHVKFAELWSDNFQDLKKSQENSAHESTKLSTLIGVPLAGAMTGANIAFFKRMKDTTTKGLEQSSTIHTAEQKLGGLLGKAADKVGINIVGNTLSRYSKIGALLGATMTLPFLPGALVGKSSEELRAEYSGEKEVAVRKDRGWLCMTPDTPIFSSVGYSRAEDIKTGDFLYNRYGTKNKVISVHKRYTKELAYEFKTAYSTNLWTTVTADHKVLTSNGWVPANKINVGDYVVTGIPKLNINSKLLDLASYVNTEKHITETAFFSKQKTRNPAVTVTGKNILCNRYIKIDYQFGLFLGWFLAEGCVSGDKNGKFRPIEISFHKTEENFAIEILEYLNKLTGNTKEIKIYPNQGEGRRIRYSNSILSEFLISFMYRDGVKIFPDLTLFNKECVKGFLIGMFYGDGSITKHKNVRNKFKLKSQYIQHLFEYRRYLSVFGIYGSIYQDRGTGCFILELSGQCSGKANELGLYKELYSYQSISKNFNCRSYYIEDEKVYVKVEKISVYEYEGYVYDYTMENIHEYTPNSFVIHNSGGTEYEGGQIKYFRQNLLKTIASDAKTKTLYGDRETKRRLDPVFNPIKYLRNPYRFEEMHQEDMPFPVWGMDVSYGSVLGQLYKGTIGELIKPTVIHPEFLKLQSEANPNLVLGVKEEIAKGISETISGKNSKKLSQLSAGNSEENSDTSIAIVDSDAYTTPENERKEVKSLIADGLMLRANAPTVSVLDRTLAGTSASLSDFTGLKGFSSSLLLGAANLDPTEQLRPELEVSGSSTNFSDTLSDANLGDMLGCFVPNTKVLTSTGYKEIQNITKGDLVLSKNGVFQKVNEVFEKSFKDIQILKVSLGLGYEDIYCTPDHVFPVIKRVRYSCGHLKPLTDFTVQDLEIGSLETGSLLMLPKNKETKVFDIDLGLTYSGVKTNCYLYPKSKYEKFGELYETLEVDPCSIAKIRPNFSNFEDDNHTYISIKRIEVFDYSGLMYDLSIENTPYYTVNDVLCHNSGEFSRRLIPQSAAVKRDTINPMRNQVAPDWLPKNETKYYKNFERGSYPSHMENGEYLLPGSKGFETLNPELKGVDPNNYPLVYQYKILQNVARGSSEHIAVKKYLAEHLDELSEKEKDVFFEAYGQDTERDVQKRFTDYKTGSEKSNMGVIGLTQNAIWESFSHLESPLEPLTPFRPMAKFVHQRTAVEDYIKTQLMGSDVGIWTNPYSHFLKPTLNRLADSGSIDQFKPKEAIEKENIDTYFDKLSLVKAVKTNDTYDIERNITALSYLGINDPGSMKRFKSALPEGQSAYVEAFSQEKDKKKRNQILSIVPKDIGRAYQSIWSNIDIYDQAILRGNDPNKALEEEYLKDSKKLKSALSIDITRQDKETIHNQASTLASDEDKKRFEQYQEAKLVRLKAAQKEASEYVENQTGSLPSDNWIGWDPRLTIDDIKLKTLTIGKEDIHRFGYWQKDLERSERLIGLKEGEIVNELEKIKAEKRSNVAKEFAIRSRLRNIGFEVSTINSVPSNSNQLKITDKQEYLRAYNNSV